MYGLDDGPKTLEESLAMLRLAAANGTTDIVATPHANLQFAFQPDLINQRLEELQRVCNGSPRIYSGCDFHLTWDNLQDALAHPNKYTINHHNYLLVEFSDMWIFHNTEEIFASLRSRGIIPVITHPERNSLLQRRLPSLTRWIEQGALIQVTAQSYLGRFGRSAQKFSRQLMQLGLVHFVASDAHDTQHRPPDLGEAFTWVAKHYGQPTAQRLFVDNPKAALEGRPLPPVTQSSLPQPRRWFEFWKR
ncbi:MAG: hypothetical protein NZV14_04480 [Bryobacteraceae bacterium]|nr:hypothetical protein [Bryobacteraceae bacterium]MDW8377390.1 CpsB/CapC family capsule biosynthesis tyrosine phosphatase [Bryobacterales bacterium]